MNKLMRSSCRCAACRDENVAYLWVKSSRRRPSPARPPRPEEQAKKKAKPAKSSKKAPASPAPGGLRRLKRLLTDN